MSADIPKTICAHDVIYSALCFSQSSLHPDSAAALPLVFRPPGTRVTSIYIFYSPPQEKYLINPKGKLNVTHII